MLSLKMLYFSSYIYFDLLVASTSSKTFCADLASFFPMVDLMTVTNCCNCSGVKPTFRQMAKCERSIGSALPMVAITETVTNSLSV